MGYEDTHVTTAPLTRGETHEWPMPGRARVIFILGFFG